jgi:hypothetical protein
MKAEVVNHEGGEDWGRRKSNLDVTECKRGHRNRSDAAHFDVAIHRHGNVGVVKVNRAHMMRCPDEKRVAHSLPLASHSSKQRIPVEIER